MPGTPQPVGSNAGLPPIWNATMQGIQHAQRMNAALAAGSTQGMMPDSNGNIIEVYGSNLDLLVTIGASHGNAGVLVRTGLPSGTAGRAALFDLCTTTITLTKGSTSASFGAVTGPGLLQGMVIGAANVNDPSSGTATPAITPGTTIAFTNTETGPGSLTLSQPAAESGTNLFCAAGLYGFLTGSTWQTLTLGTNVTSWGNSIPAARLQGDQVLLRGIVTSSTSMTSSSVWITVPSAMAPTRSIGGVAGFVGTVVAPMSFTIATNGQMPVSGSVTNVNEPLILDGITYALT